MKPEARRKINTNLDTQLVQWIQGSKLCKYWVDHKIFPFSSSSTVDWEAIGAAQQKNHFSDVNGRVDLPATFSQLGTE
eukprot:15360054-Ditylum_brightwellii.AAC.1